MGRAGIGKGQREKGGDERREKGAGRDVEGQREMGGMGEGRSEKGENGGRPTGEGHMEEGQGEKGGLGEGESEKEGIVDGQRSKWEGWGWGKGKGARVGFTMYDDMSS